MKTHPHGFFSFVLVLAGTPTPGLLAAPGSDLTAPSLRQASVRVAQQLVRSGNISAAPDVPNPFLPPDFELPVDENSVRKPEGGAPQSPVAPKSDREIIESLALRFPATGTITRGGKVLLAAGPRQFEVGQVLKLSEPGHDYEVAIAAVSATTFTMRYRNEEFTRPIRVSN